MRVAVIGSGASGLTAIKSCKEENLEVVCYERSDNIGGLWRYRDSDQEGLASVTKSTIINTSKELTAFSDFPPPKEFPNYMHNTVVFRYLRLYAEKFDLIPHIRFHHLVESVVSADDYHTTGRWKITTLNLKSEEKKQEIVDAVMVCTGHHVFPNTPTFPGQEKFEGSIIHTRSYKTYQQFRDKTVVVVGTGNSAADAAVDISNVANKVYLSTRRGCWIVPRLGDNGKPIDDNLSRFNMALMNSVPFKLLCWLVERKMNSRFDHRTYQLKPKHRFFQQHPTVNDDLPNKILSGRIIVKGNIQRFEKNAVIFDGQTEIVNVDRVIFATGYDIKLPFLDKNIIDTTDNRVQLYKFVYPPNLKHPTLAVIGLIQVLGGAFSVFEMQSRWFVQVLLKKVTLPSEKHMREDIETQLEKIRKRFYNCKRHTIEADYIKYLDEIASFIGVKPNFSRMLFSDPKLFWASVMGPCLSYQYRLRGVHRWSQARKTIIEYQERVYHPLQTRYRSKKQKRSPIFTYSITFFVIFIFLILFKIN